MNSNNSLHSSIALASTPFLTNGGKNNQMALTTTKPSVRGTDTAQCHCHFGVKTFFTPTYTTKHTP